jgi:beta-galactosidase beta subunit
VVKGVERFGIIDHLTSKPNSKWKPDVIHYNYDRKLTRFYDSTPDKFFIFFPCDWHIAKVNNDTNDQNIRVIVIKVDYVD